MNSLRHVLCFLLFLGLVAAVWFGSDPSLAQDSSSTGSGSGLSLAISVPASDEGPGLFDAGQSALASADLGAFGRVKWKNELPGPRASAFGDLRSLVRREARGLRSTGRGCRR